MRNPLINYPLVFSLALILGTTSSINAHTDSNETSESGVEHAQQDAYWAEKAKDFPAFVPPVEAANRSVSAAQRPVDEGAWGPIINWPHIPVTAANLPDGRILTFASNERNRFPQGPEFTFAATWDPATGQFLERNHTGHDMFCGHLASLEDGRIFINGGRNHVTTTSTFDYRTNTWRTIDPMNRGRWYPTTLALPNGSVLTALGSSGGQYPEIWTEGQGWKSLTGVDLQNPILSYTQMYERESWPSLHVDPRGKVFHSGPTPKMHSINTNGLGSITKVGPDLSGFYANNGTTVMYDEGKLLIAGGAVSGPNEQATNKARIIDINNEEPRVTDIPSMNYARKFLNGVVLPTGEVLVVGGNTSGQKFNDSGTVLPTEIWNPDTNRWRVIDSISVPRNYHSIALLLTDGRVLSAGGGLCGCSADQSNGQVLTPPYLYNADGSLASRPRISNAPDIIKAAQSFNLQSSTDITKFSLIKMSATTHAVNTDLRYLKVPFTHDGNGNYQLTAHKNTNVLTPGHWMLFAVNSKGVPSVSKVIRVSTSGVPIVNPVNTQTSIVGETISLTINANDPLGDALTYSASQLPSGLSMNSRTGKISGKVTTNGSYETKITVSNSNSSSEIYFTWVVYEAGSAPGVSFEYYEGEWSKLPNFDLLTPANTGIFNNFVISPRPRNDNFAFRLSSRIVIDKADVYTFYTTSDDGSRLWVNGNLVVDNDGLHGMQERSGQISLNAGQHSVVVGYFEREIGEGLNVKYSSASLSKRAIPNAKLVQRPQINVAPVLRNPGNQNSSVSAAVNLNIIASDINNDALTYSASGLPNGLSINTNSGLISGRTNTAGSFTVQISVKDNQGESANTSFNWTVKGSINITPIESGPKLRNSSVSYTANVSGGGSLRYKWNFGDNVSTSFNSSPSTTHKFSKEGTYVVTLFVQDGSETPIEHQFVQAIYAPTTSNRSTNSSSLAYEVRSGNNRIWSVNPDNNSVTAFNTGSHSKVSEITVGKKPHSLAFAPNGRLWVTNKDSATISIINTGTLKVEKTLSFKSGSQPHGIAFAPNNSAAYVVLEASGQLKRLNPTSGDVTGTINIGSHPRHISVTGDSSKIFVSRFITPRLPGEDTAKPITSVGSTHFGGEVLVIKSNTMSISKTIILKHNEIQDSEHSGRGIPNYLGPVVISPDGNSAWVASKQDNIKRGKLRDNRQLTHDSTVRSISSKINLANEQEDVNLRVDHDNGGIASTSLFSETGNYLFVALEGSREVAVVDAYNNKEFYRFNVGRAPQGLALSENGMKLYTHNFMDRSISVHDISRIIEAREPKVNLLSTYNLVSNESLAINVLNGKQLFYDALDQRLARERYVSCASCHNEGDSDGRVWDMTGFGEGLRNTISLVGHGGTDHGPLHWSANFDEVQDFEGQIRSMSGGLGLMQDNLFMSGTHSSPLGQKKAGLSQELDDLAAYVASLDRMPISPNRNGDGSLTPNGIKGKALFASKGCDSCHSGESFTDSADNNLHNIGTIKSTSGKRLNANLSGIDTPTVRGLWLTAPYLHDGSAKTITDAIAAHTNVSTTSSERTLISSYLNQLDRAASNVFSGMSNEVATGKIVANGNASDWNGIPTFTNDPNDVTGSKNPININNISIAHDDNNLHFLFRNHRNVDTVSSSGTYLAWGWQTFIDTDNNSTTGYQVGGIGADYIIEGRNVQQYKGSGSDWKWLRTGKGTSAYTNNIAEITVDRGLLGNPSSFKFLFIGANESYGGTATDFYPDALNDSQASANKRHFEYSLNGGTTDPTLFKPTANVQTVSVPRNGNTEITLRGTDPQNDPLTYAIESSPRNGLLSGSGRAVTYTPNNGFTGSDTFTFTVNDGVNTSDPAKVTINVTPPVSGITSNPVINVKIDANANDWNGLIRFPEDPNDITGSENIIDWQNIAFAHSSEKLFILYKNRNTINSGSGTHIPWGWQTYFDVDNKASTGYQIGGIGADYILEGHNLHRYTGNGTSFSLSDPEAAESWYKNDVIELAFNRSQIGNPSKIRVVFFGNNEAYEGLGGDFYPDNSSGNSSGAEYFEYSFASSVQAANRPEVNSQNLTTAVNRSLPINLTSPSNESDLDYSIVNQPKNGTLSGSGPALTYTPNENYQGSDMFQYIAQGNAQSSIATIELKIGTGTSTGSGNSETESGGGSMPINLGIVLLMLFTLRKRLNIINRKN